MDPKKLLLVLATLALSAWGCGETSDDAEVSDDFAGPDSSASGGDGSASGGQSGADDDASGDQGNGGENAGTGGSGSEPLAEKPSAGCNGSASPPTGAQSVTVATLERTYVVSLPAGYDPSHAYPLVFAFHGQGNSGAGVSGPYYFGIEQQGGTPSIFVYPDGLADEDGTGWPNRDGRDVAFFDALLAKMNAAYCVDENRVFSTGHSYGGIMSYTLACERAEVLRGVAPVAGMRWANSACSGPVAAWGAHGNPDPTVTYESGVSAMARILETNGCDSADATPVEPTATCIAYACDSGYPVTWCEHGQGHDWPAFAASSIKTFIDSF